MRKWNRITTALAGVVIGLGLLVAPVGVQASEETGTTTQTPVNEIQQTEPDTAELAASAAVKLDADKIGETSSYNDMVYVPEKNGMFFLHTVGEEVYDNSKQYEIVFYDMTNETYTTVYTSRYYIEDAYMNEDAVYFATTDYKRNTDASSDSYSYACQVEIDSYNFKTGAEKQQNFDTFNVNGYWANLISALGVDGAGRYYIATHEDELYLFSPDGKLLSQKGGAEDIYEFLGFDQTNGNFYYLGQENWRYWGFDHSMASLKAGKVNRDNSITIKGANMMYLYQFGWFTHKTPVRMLNGRYLATLSTFNGEICALVGSNQYDINDVTESSTSISLIDSSVSVSPINIANKNALKMAFYTADSDYGDDENFDLSSIGPRCVLNSAGTSLIAKTDKKVLTEYDIATNKEKIRMQTSPVCFCGYRILFLALIPAAAWLLGVS